MYGRTDLIDLDIPTSDLVVDLPVLAPLIAGVPRPEAAASHCGIRPPFSAGPLPSTQALDPPHGLSLPAVWKEQRDGAGSMGNRETEQPIDGERAQR